MTENCMMKQGEDDSNDDAVICLMHEGRAGRAWP